MSQQIQLRRDAAAVWTSVNPVLAQGEIGIETDTGKAKAGDGVTAWASLGYWKPDGAADGVASVFGRSGAVTAQTGDYTAAQVGADASGAAAAVLASSAQKSANLSDLASASTARTNLGLGSAAVHASTDFDAAGAAAAAAAASVPLSDLPLSLANGGTGQTAQQAALDALAGAVTSGQLLRGNGTHVTLAAIQAGDVPTLNQSTSGTAAGLSGTPALPNGTTATTQTAANNSTRLATTAYADGAAGTAQAAAIAASLPTLAQASASASATLAVNTVTTVTAATALTMTLPTSVTGALIVVERESASAASVAVTGSIRGVGSSTITLSLASESEMFLGSGGSWWPVAGHKTLGSLDGRYWQQGAQVQDKGGVFLDVRQYGAKCDGGVSQSGTVNTSTAVVTDTTPPAVIPVAQQLVTWVSQSAALGGGITGVSISGWTVTVTTASAHGLSAGQQVTLASVGGAVQLNGTWPVASTPLSTTFTFTCPWVNSTSAYTSGGTLAATTIVFGYISAPAVNAGTLTFTIVTAPGGSTPATVPAGLVTSGTYYYGSDDISAWNAAIAAAEVIASPAGSVQVWWEGTSMVSAAIVVNGNVTVCGSRPDYTNPDGTASSSTLPMRGSVLRPHGNFTSAATAALLQLGTSVNTATGHAGAGTRGGCFDAANIVMSALRTLGSRNRSEGTYALNGIQRAWDWQGSNSTADSGCIGGMSNTGDVLFVGSGGDCKWRGEYLRQGAVMVHTLNAVDFYCGGGVHLFTGFNGGETYGNDIWIESGAGGNSNSLNFDGIILDGCVGHQIYISTTNASGNVSEVAVSAVTAFQPGAAYVDATYDLINIDTHTGGVGGAVKGVTLNGWDCNSASSSRRYRSVIGQSGTGGFGVAIGPGNANNCVTHYNLANSATRSQYVPEFASGRCNNGASSLFSVNSGTWSATGDGSTVSFTVTHKLSTTPQVANLTPSSAAAVGAYISALGSSTFTITFAIAPSNGAALSGYWRAAI